MKTWLRVLFTVSLWGLAGLVLGLAVAGFALHTHPQETTGLTTNRYSINIWVGVVCGLVIGLVLAPARLVRSPSRRAMPRSKPPEMLP